MEENNNRDEPSLSGNTKNNLANFLVDVSLS